MTYAVILAGGIGSRFWPFSRELEPKQFMRVAGKLTLLQATIKRLKGRIRPQNTYLVTNPNYFHEVKRQTKGFSIPERNIILEPEGKNTAPAIGLCAKLIGQVDKEAVLVILPCDHHIGDLEKFRRCLDKAITCAAGGFLVTIGIKPKKPSSAFGYIKLKPKIKRGKGNYYPVERFLEKPGPKQAKKYFKDRRFFWNSGIFVWKASVFMRELELYLPELYSCLERIKSRKEIAGVWPKITPISVDYGILEHSKRVALVAADFKWSDLGSWDALDDIFPKKNKGNIFQADCLDIGSSGISVYGRSRRLISSIGLKDLIIVDTPDALLVCDKQRTQQVKKIVQRLKSSKRKEYFVHTTEKRHWGSYTVLDSARGFKIKIIEIEPKKRISLQRHKKRAEHWVVVSGLAKVTDPKGTRLLQSNQSIYIPKGSIHRLENPADSILKIVEVQTGSYLEEDDIERFKD